MVAAQEREVAELRRDVEKLLMELAVAAASDYGADLKLQKKDATIAELKEALRKIAADELCNHAQAARAALDKANS